MGNHHTKVATTSQSQTNPGECEKVASDTTLGETYVLLCDWHGKLVWKSSSSGRIQPGDHVWKHMSAKSKEPLRAAIAKVATLRETCVLEIENEIHQHFRLWMWPLDEPDIAICVLAKRIPSELSLLTEREKACPRLLAQGNSTREISQDLSIGLTTVHTHLRRSREKLALTSVEALISYAARYFYVPPAPTEGDSIVRMRSG